MRLFKSRGDERRWSRRLVDEETYDFVHDVLDKTSEVFRTASGEFQLRGLCIDVFGAAPTADVRWLKSRGVEGATFYRRELAPSWDGLEQAERADRIDQFIRLSHMLGGVEPEGEAPAEFLDLVSSVHLKVLLLAWAYDRTYSYMDRLFNGPLQYPLTPLPIGRRALHAKRGFSTTLSRCPGTLPTRASATSSRSARRPWRTSSSTI